MIPLKYHITENYPTLIIKVNNLLHDFESNALLKDIQHRVEKGWKKLIVDLSQLDFMNSSGLNFLIRLMTKSEKVGGHLIVVNASKQVLSLLEMTKLKAKFNLSNSLEEAHLKFDNI